MATVADFTDEDPTRPLLTAEGRDPTAPPEDGGESFDVSGFVTGGGLPPMLPPPPRMQLASFQPTLAEEPGIPSGVPTAEVLREGAAPAPAEEPGPLLGPWGEFEKSQRELYQAEREALDAQRTYQEGAMDWARQQLAAGYGPVREAGQEVIDLAEQQRLRRPPIPTPPVEPAVPRQRIEPFGVGPEKETGMQALNRIMGTLGLMAQMGMGMKSGYTRGAMASFSGALDGWAKGQQIKAQQEWREYLANVQKIDREWARERQHFDDILRTDAVDLDRVKTKMAIRQTELGYHKSMVDLTLRDVDQRFKMFDVERQMIQNVLKNSLTATNMQMLANERALTRADIAKYRTGILQNQEMTRRLQEQRDRATAAYQQGQLGAGARTATEQERHHKAVEAEAKRWHDMSAAEKAEAKAEKAQKVGVQQRQIEAASQGAQFAVDQLDKIVSDPRASKDLAKYLGTGGQQRIDWASSTSLLATPPKAASDASTWIATMKNHILNLISGKQVAQHEEVRLDRMLPKISSKPEVFAREVENIKPYIEYLNKLPNKGDAAPAQLPQFQERPYGATSVYGIGPASKHAQQYAKEGNKQYYSDGTQWWTLNRQGKWVEAQ